METIKQVSTDYMSINMTYNSLLALCDKHSFLEKHIFSLCCNSIYVCVHDDIDSRTLGIIACRRLYADNSQIKFLEYHPSKHNAIYKIEALHFDNSMSDQAKIDLIETCLNDKKDAFVILEAKCENVIESMDMLKSIGFIKPKYDSEDDSIILIREPLPGNKKRMFS